jgi:hypothetical protein
LGEIKIGSNLVWKLVQFFTFIFWHKWWLGILIQIVHVHYLSKFCFHILSRLKLFFLDYKLCLYTFLIRWYLFAQKIGYFVLQIICATIFFRNPSKLMGRKSFYFGFFLSSFINLWGKKNFFY